MNIWGLHIIFGSIFSRSDKWNNLLEHIEARDLKLQGAGEIHRFHRDVADALARIQEKTSSIPEGVGRDVNSCESMLRLHETFENDLLALEAQLQVSTYPAMNMNMSSINCLCLCSLVNVRVTSLRS